jgi:hypothetical protein
LGAVSRHGLRQSFQTANPAAMPIRVRKTMITIIAGSPSQIGLHDIRAEIIFNEDQ